jgi:hypothetical protein
MRTGHALAAFAIVCAGAGCGPIASLAKIVEAQVELDAATVAGGHQAAPYEYTSAELYLKKAQEEHGYADFGPATEFAQQAVTHAKEARKKALAQRAGTGAPPPPPSPNP